MELLVVVAIIGILASLLFPALAKAKSKGQTVRCAANMKNWAWATQLYLDDYNNCLPLFGELSTDNSKPFWHAKLAPYLAVKSQPNTFYAYSDIFTNDLRRCPGGRQAPPPFAKFPGGAPAPWNCWIGANFGALGQPLTAPFYYGDKTPPLNVTRIARPDDAMLYLDGYGHGIYTPVQERYRFVLDLNGDGAPDTMAAYPDIPFNFARPTVHNNGANVTLLDGHIERVSFKKLWHVDSFQNVTHSFWYLND